MQLSHRHLPAFTVMGLSTRTTNALEGTPEGGKIGPLIQKYYEEKIVDQLPSPVFPGVSYSLYAAYESDFQSPYTYLFGEQVPEGSVVPDGLTLFTVPAQAYAVFTVGPGPMPALVINAWQKIWQMNEKELGGRRLYLGDFERYDQRAANPEQAIVDIYVGIAS